MVEPGHDEEGSPTESAWVAQVAVGKSVRLLPDAHIMDSLGGNHSLETAVADLVDNSLDAKATRILIRFVIADNRLRTLYVVDDGTGMTPDQIDAAMTAGSVRAYDPTELGHFGLGLKSASFSQANSLTVLSRAAGSPPVGRRWLKVKASTSFECDVVSARFCRHELSRPWQFIKSKSGTIIRWDDVQAFPSGQDPAVASRFVHDATTRIQQHLGMVFEKFLSAGSIKIGIDVEDAATQETGPVVEVTALNPFGYLRSGASDFPKILRTDFDGVPLNITCHVWPGRSQLPQFRLPTNPAEQYQGLYFYRNDRLLQAGGWNNVEVQHRQLQLARVEILLTDQLVRSSAFRMNPEKSHVSTGPEFAEALDRARADDGTTFQGYIDIARQAFKAASKRRHARAPIVPLGRGVPSAVRRAFARELDVLPGRDQVDIRWRQLPAETFFKIDRVENVIFLNKRYREAVVGVGNASLNDAPLTKTLVFLLVESLFHGAWLGAKEKDNLDLWQTLLTEAAKSEGGSEK